MCFHPGKHTHTHTHRCLMLLIALALFTNAVTHTSSDATRQLFVDECSFSIALNRHTSVLTQRQSQEGEREEERGREREAEKERGVENRDEMMKEGDKVSEVRAARQRLYLRHTGCCRTMLMLTLTLP